MSKITLTKTPKAPRRRGPPVPTAVTNAGQRELLILQWRGEYPSKLADIAAVTGCSKMTVSRWLRGLRTPEPEAAAKLEAAYGIPIIAWRWTAPKTEIERIRLYGRTPAAGSESRWAE